VAASEPLPKSLTLPEILSNPENVELSPDLTWQGAESFEEDLDPLRPIERPEVAEPDGSTAEGLQGCLLERQDSMRYDRYSRAIDAVEDKVVRNCPGGRHPEWRRLLQLRLALERGADSKRERERPRHETHLARRVGPAHGQTRDWIRHARQELAAHCAPNPLDGAAANADIWTRLEFADVSSVIEKSASGADNPRMVRGDDVWQIQLLADPRERNFVAVEVHNLGANRRQNFPEGMDEFSPCSDLAINPPNPRH
jgi:hypothetical protein